MMEALEWGSMKRVLPVAVLIVAVIGLMDATYMALADYGVVKLYNASLPVACRIGPGGCQDVIRSPLGRFMGIPTPILGGLYFLTWIVAAGWRLHTNRWPAPPLLLLLLTGGLALSAYLLHALFFRVASPCPYCLLAHTLNIIIAGMVILSLRADGFIDAAIRAVRDQFRSYPTRRWRTHP